MPALVRCPQCDTFVKPPSISAGACPFCPSPEARSLRNPIPGMVLAAAMAAVPACSSSTPAAAPVSAEPAPTPAEPAPPEPVYGIAVEDTDTPKMQTPDAAVPIKAEPPEEVDIYGIAPDTD